MEKILVIGALGQLGSELTTALVNKFGTDNVIASDIKEYSSNSFDCMYLQIDALKSDAINQAVQQNSITQIFHLAAILSAKGEKNPPKAWDINMNSLLNVLEAGKQFGTKIFWPSSIAVFGPSTPRHNTPQETIMNPNTVYGISKLAGERWCEYYHQKFGVDVRSLRYPGLIGWKTMPGGGTTDYAVDIYHYALRGEEYTCFLKQDTYLPMMYMDDAVRATIELMNATPENIRIRSSYNVAAMSFSPAEVTESIRKKIPEFRISYSPDYRQQIAESWPASIDDSPAKKQWNWKPEFNLQGMTDEMLFNLEQMFKKAK